MTADNKITETGARRIRILEEALVFYANPQSWKTDEEAWARAEAGDDDPETLDALLSDVEVDGGKRARAALAEGKP